jgi:hypothetical protein
MGVLPAVEPQLREVIDVARIGGANSHFQMPSARRR